jgi:hypothetical protein
MAAMQQQLGYNYNHESFTMDNWKLVVSTAVSGSTCRHTPLNQLPDK